MVGQQLLRAIGNDATIKTTSATNASVVAYIIFEPAGSAATMAIEQTCDGDTGERDD